MSQTLAVSVYRPRQEPKASVVIVHGMAEHRKRYDDFARYLQRQGYAVFTYDLPGHGETVGEDGLKGYFGPKNGWNNLVKSAKEIVDESKRQYPNAGVVLFGHSMGSMIARCFIQQYDDEIIGCILSGAPCYNSSTELGLKVANAIKSVKGPKNFSRTLDMLIVGSLNKPIENPKTPLDWLSYNDENIKRYVEDPMCGFPFTIQGYIDELEGMKQMHDVDRFEMKNADLPIFLFAGESDPCIGGKEGFNDTVGTLRKAGYVNISSRLYPHMRHETLNEIDRIRVFDEVVDWLNNLTN